MNEELTLQRFERVVNYDDFVDLALELSTSPQPELFNFLFTQSISSGRGASIAACLLVEIDPTVCWPTCAPIPASAALPDSG